MFENFNSFIILSISLIGLAAWNVYLYLQLRQTKKKLKIFFQGRSATDLEGVLCTGIKQLKKAEKDIKELFESMKMLEKVSEQSVQKVGIIRFNPFRETGGDQSFAIALLDHYDNGFVISSLYTRNGARIYGKPIKMGKSKYPLSKEEIEVLHRAGVK